MVNIRDYNLGNYTVPEEVFGGICVDIGSNVGSFLSGYSDRFSIINYYEPYSVCYNICKNLNIKNSVGYNEAVYHTSDLTMELIPHSNNDSGSTALKTDITTDTHGWNPHNILEKVKTVNLEKILTRIGGYVDYMKIDCETGEYNLLMHKDLASIKYIAIELHCQLEKDRWDELVSYLMRTHSLISGDCHFDMIVGNKEALFVLK